MIGRAAARLPGLPCDLLPFGWRLTARPGRDQRRAETFWRTDLDDLAEVCGQLSGPLKVSLCGPWTLAANLWLPRGERVLSDVGAVQDVHSSWREAAAELTRSVHRLVPQAEVIFQVDEPSLAAVLAGSLRSASGLNRLPAVNQAWAMQLLADAHAAVQAAGAAAVTIHSSAPGLPWAELAKVGLAAAAVDLGVLGSAELSQLAEAVDSGLALWLGLPKLLDQPVADQVDQLLAWWRRLDQDLLSQDQIVLTPSCGLAGQSVQQAQRQYQRLAELAVELLERR